MLPKDKAGQANHIHGHKCYYKSLRCNRHLLLATGTAAPNPEPSTKVCTDSTTVISVSCVTSHSARCS